MSSVEQASAAVPLVPRELLDPVVAYFNPPRVIVFGSQARGEAGPDSDIDLLVIVDDDTPPEKLTIRAGYEARQPYRRAADVFPCRESTFAKKRGIAGTLAYEAAIDGIVVYERCPAAGGSCSRADRLTRAGWCRMPPEFR